MAAMQAEAGQGASIDRASRPGSVPAATRTRRPPHVTAWKLVSNVVVRFIAHDDALIAAGVAFYGFLAVFPALAIFISLYGLLFDLSGVTRHAAQLASILPDEARPIVLDFLQALALKGPTRLNTGLLIASAIALWSSRAGVAALMSGVNFAYEVRDDRNIFVSIGISLALTIGAVVFAILTLTVIAAVPVAMQFLHVPYGSRATLLPDPAGRSWRSSRSSRYRPSISSCHTGSPEVPGASARRMMPGAHRRDPDLAAGLLAVLVLRHAHRRLRRHLMASLGGPVIFLLWLWFTVLVVLVGAEINVSWSGLKTPKQRHETPEPN